jgi:putative transferase (TIGR04331 family)
MATPLANARYRPKRLRIGSLDYVNDRERVAFAFAKENGERLVQVQHGGNYGVAKSVSVEATLEYSQDAFVTWGWTEQEDCVGRFIPLPSPFLGKYANRHCASNNNLLLVGTSIRFRFLRISSTPQPSQYLRYLKDKVSFIGNLTKKPKGCTVYRPYGRGHNDINDARFIETRCPGIAIMEECDHKHFIENHLLKCRLLVLDHNSTTLNVALAANIPTVCFWEDDAWSICRQAQPHFDKLKECKILFHDPVQAAEHVNRVWDDVSAWWNDEKVQQSRREWVGLFALNSRLWWMDWIKILSRL